MKKTFKFLRMTTGLFRFVWCKKIPSNWRCQRLVLWSHYHRLKEAPERAKLSHEKARWPDANSLSTRITTMVRRPLRNDVDDSRQYLLTKASLAHWTAIQATRIHSTTRAMMMIVRQCQTILHQTTKINLICFGMVLCVLRAKFDRIQKHCTKMTRLNSNLCAATRLTPTMTNTVVIIRNKFDTKCFSWLLFINHTYQIYFWVFFNKSFK